MFEKTSHHGYHDRQHCDEKLRVGKEEFLLCQGSQCFAQMQRHIEQIVGIVNVKNMTFHFSFNLIYCRYSSTAWLTL